MYLLYIHHSGVFIMIIPNGFLIGPLNSKFDDMGVA